MEKFWNDAINQLLGTCLYNEDHTDDGKTWTDAYAYETENMVADIKCFHKSLKRIKLDVSNKAMANFMVYTEYIHIGNTIAKIDKSALILLAAQVNDKLNEESEE